MKLQICFSYFQIFCIPVVVLYKTFWKGNLNKPATLVPKLCTKVHQGHQGGTNKAALGYFKFQGHSVITSIKIASKLLLWNGSVSRFDCTTSLSIKFLLLKKLDLWCGCCDEKIKNTSTYTQKILYWRSVSRKKSVGNKKWDGSIHSDFKVWKVI